MLKIGKDKDFSAPLHMLSVLSVCVCVCVCVLKGEGLYSTTARKVILLQLASSSSSFPLISLKEIEIFCLEYYYFCTDVSLH
jgi:hypothetical protein